MKKTAVLVYNQFCNFEISVALEILAMGEKPVTIIGKNLTKVTSEEGLTVIPGKQIVDIDLEEYDSLLLPGAMDIGEVVEDSEIHDFIKAFDEQKKVIGAISIAPILLVKSGVLGNRPFMAGVNPEDLYEEGFTEIDLKNMQGWDANLNHPIEAGYVISDHIITSISYEFVRFGLAFGKMLGIEISPKTFGIRD